MPVLKASQHGQPFAKDAIVLDLGDLGRQAARLRAQAETRAAQIITDAERKAAALIEGAEQRGFEQGRAAGHAQGLAQGRDEGREEALAQTRQALDALQQAWSDVAGQLEGGRREIDREARQAVLEFALKLSERVVHRVIEVDPTVIVDQVAAALSHVMRPLDVTVRVNPHDKPLLEQALPELLAEFRQFEHLRLVDDEGVAPGGCRVTYGEGEVDATVQTQLERIVDLILPVEQDDAMVAEHAAAATPSAEHPPAPLDRADPPAPPDPSVDASP